MRELQRGPQSLNKPITNTQECVSALTELIKSNAGCASKSRTKLSRSNADVPLKGLGLATSNSSQALALQGTSSSSTDFTNSPGATHTHLGTGCRRKWQNLNPLPFGIWNDKVILSSCLRPVVTVKAVQMQGQPSHVRPRDLAEASSTYDRWVLGGGGGGEISI